MTTLKLTLTSCYILAIYNNIDWRDYLYYKDKDSIIENPTLGSHRNKLLYTNKNKKPRSIRYIYVFFILTNYKESLIE